MPEELTKPVANYTIYIDSTFRDMTVFTNPFKFNIEFDPLPGSPAVGIPMSVKEIFSLKFGQIILPVRLVPYPGERYFILRIKEIDIPYQYHSNPVLNNNTDLLLYNSGIGGPNLYLDCKSTLQFPMGIRGRLKKLSLEFLTFNGDPLIPTSNATCAEVENWNLVFPHLFVDSEGAKQHLTTTCPDLDPTRSINNVFMELQLVASCR